jgi:hypothetical protein
MAGTTARRTAGFDPDAACELISPGMTVAGGSPDVTEGAGSHAAHALEAAEVALANQEGQAEDDDHGNEGPYQQLHA